MSTGTGNGAGSDFSEDERPRGLGEIIELGPLFNEKFPPFEERRIENTRSRLAFLLLGLLALTLLALFLLLAFGRIQAGEFSDLAGVLLAPLVGLVASATGYYYGKTDRG